MWAALIASIAVEYFGASEGAEAVVTSPEVVARSANSNQSPRRFPEDLPGGAEIQILEEHENWARIRLANGRDAWVRADSVTRVVENG